jgi:plastocyanin
VCALALLAAEGRSAATQTHTVVIEGMQFKPQTLAVHTGDRVVWENRDLFPHTATAENKSFDSGSLAPNAKWVYVARKSGTFSYVCSLHPTMKGILKVQ